jgi:hypothetical protein
VEKWAQRIVVPAMFAVPVLCAFRWAVGNGIELGNFEIMFDKWHLGAMRLVNFAAIAALAIRLQRPLAHLAIGPLVLLGRASIQVFCAHLLFCFVGLAVMGTRSTVSGWQQAVLLALTLGALYLTARLFAKRDAPEVHAR